MDVKINEHNLLKEIYNVDTMKQKSLDLIYTNINNHSKKLTNKIVNDNTNNNNDNTYNDGRYTITRVNIDSSNRIKEPKNIIANKNGLLNKPFSLIKDTNKIKINIKNNGYSINDKIVIINVINEPIYLNKIEFIKSSNYVKIYHPNHNLQPFNQSNIYSPYKILIQNITYGLNINTSIKGIPLNMLNNYHIIYLNTDNSDTYDINYYYIKLDVVANDNYIYDTNYTITHQDLYGIPLNDINANYPVSQEQKQGYHIINEIIDENNFYIQVNNVANMTINNCGNNNIIIEKVDNYIEGYPDNNNYKINLGKTFNNVKMIKMISSEFPNTQKTINSTNNKLYWQTITDGDYIYSMTINQGNYNFEGIIEELENQFNNTKLKNTITNDSTTNTTSIKSTTFKSKVNINKYTHKLTIELFNSITIENPFSFIQNNNEPNIYYLSVNHPNHSLSINSTIVISNSLSVNVIPTNIINATHQIYQITDDNTYLIKLPKFNKLNDTLNSSVGGGLMVTIDYPLKFRLLMDKQGTIGTILGFRNVGEYNSITEWDYMVGNSTKYNNENEPLLDVVGKPIEQNLYINLFGDNYLLMKSPLFKNTINDIFSKIQLYSIPDYIVYNSYIQMGYELNDNIKSIADIEFAFYNKNNIDLYDFNNIEHSYTLEIYENI